MIEREVKGVIKVYEGRIKLLLPTKVAYSGLGYS